MYLYLYRAPGYDTADVSSATADVSSAQDDLEQELVARKGHFLYYVITFRPSVLKHFL